MLHQVAAAHRVNMFIQVTYQVYGTYRLGWNRGTGGSTGEYKPKPYDGLYADNYASRLIPQSKIPEECDSLPYSNEAKSTMKEMLDSLVSLKP